MAGLALPTQYGKADWTDYTDYWRESDAEYLQARTVLRYATSVLRGGDWPTPSPGQVTYNAETDQLEHFAGTAPTKWIGVLASQHLRVSPKTSASDNDPAILGHRGAGGGGLQFFPTVATENKIALVSSYLDIGGGAIVAKPTSLVVGVPTTHAQLSIKTGAKTVVLTTNATDLVCDSPINMPSFTTAGMTFTGTLSGGGASIVNANTGTIGGVGLQSNYVNASSGYVAQAGYHHGDANGAIMRYRAPSTGAVTGSYIRMDSNNFTAVADYFDVKGQFRIWNTGGGVQYLSDAGTLLGTGGPVLYQAGTPTVGNYPEGTIWVTP